MFSLKSVLERPHKDFLVRRDNNIGGFIEAMEVVPQIFKWTLVDVEQVGGGYLSMVTGGKLVCQFPHQFLIAVKRGTWKAHLPSKGDLPKITLQKLTF